MIASHGSLGTESTTHNQARQRLDCARKALSESIREYLNACQAMGAACSAFPGSSRAASNERESTQVAIDEELIAWEDGEASIQKARDTLLEARNLCKMIAPIYSLPPEILSRVFTKAICWCNDFLMHATSPIILAAVCRRWRNIVLDNRSLWAHLDLELYNTQPRYPNPGLWAEHSGGAPITIYIHQYHFHEPTTQHDDYDSNNSYDDYGDYDDYYDPYRDSDDDSDDVPASYDDQFEAPELDDLGNFIASLMQQICSITLDITEPKAAILERLLRATSGKAKVLKVKSPDHSDVLMIPSWHQRSAFYCLETLHFRNAVPPCRNWRLHNLTDLRLQITSTKAYRWSMSQLEFSSLLNSCPKLRYLFVEIPGFSESHNHVPIPVQLSELKVLDIKSESSGALESLLAIISPGEHLLHLLISLFLGPHSLEPFVSALRKFLGRSNVPLLHLRNKYIPSFASMLRSLPGVQILSLQGWYFTDLADVGRYSGGQPIYTINPNPGPPHRTLWPQVQKLFLRYCTFEKNHFDRLISSDALQKVYLNDCDIYNETYSSLQLDPQTSSKYLDLLPGAAPEIQHVTDKSETWLGLGVQLKGLQEVPGVDVIKDSW